MPAPLPDTGIPSKISFRLIFETDGQGHRQVDGSINVTDGSAALPEAINHIWPDMCEEVPGLQQCDRFILSVTRER